MAIPAIFKEKGWMTTTEAAIVVGVHRATIWNAVQQQHLPSKMVGNSLALEPADVITYRDNWRRGKVTSTSATPAKKGRPRLTAKCSECTGTIAVEAAQVCRICFTEGLGNCCINPGDHNCLRQSGAE